MIIFYVPNSTQYLNLTTTLITINKQQIRSLLRQVVVNNLLILWELDLKIKCDQNKYEQILTYLDNGAIWWQTENLFERRHEFCVWCQ